MLKKIYIINTTIIFFIIFSFMGYANKIDDIIGVYFEPVTIFADLNGDYKNEKVVITQSKNGKYVSEIYHINIKVYEDNELVFEHNFDNKLGIWYVQKIRIPNGPISKDFYRDFLLIMTSSGTTYLNILCWESQITEEDVVKRAMSGSKYKFKGRYRFIKTDIQVNTPYG